MDTLRAALRPDHLPGLQHLLAPPQVIAYLLVGVLADQTGQRGADDAARGGTG